MATNPSYLPFSCQKGVARHPSLCYRDRVPGVTHPATTEGDPMGLGRNTQTATTLGKALKEELLRLPSMV